MASAAQRRLARILADEEYGPKLARLRGNAETRILHLIQENKGKEARAAILEEDENRRVKRRAPTASRAVKEQKAVDNILRKLTTHANHTTVSRNVKLMTIVELDFAADATSDELRRRATQGSTRKDSRGNDVNPFWYH